MKLFAILMAVALGLGTPAADDSTHVPVTGVTPYGGYQPYVLSIRLPDGELPNPSAVKADANIREIGFSSFFIAPGEYKVTYKCGSNHEPTYQGEAPVTFRAGQRYVLTCTSDPARLRVDEYTGAGPNNSFKPKPLRGSA